MLATYPPIVVRDRILSRGCRHEVLFNDFVDDTRAKSWTAGQAYQRTFCYIISQIPMTPSLSEDEQMIDVSI